MLHLLDQGFSSLKVQLHLEEIAGSNGSPDRTTGTSQGLAGIHTGVEAARAVRSCDYFPFHSEGENAPHLPRSRVTGIPPGFRSCHPTGLTSPHPSRSPRQGTAIPMSHPSVFLSLPATLAALWLGREARTDPSRLCLPTEFERTQEGAFPAAGTAHTAGTLTLFALWQRGVPPEVSSAGAAVGALQGVPRVAGEGHGVPCPVVIAAGGHRPIPDTWEWAVGSWERERKCLPTRLPGAPAAVEGVRAAWCP